MDLFDFIKKSINGIVMSERRTYNDAVKGVIRKLRDYSVSSIADCARDYLNRKSKSGNEAYKLPWIVLLVLKIVIESKDIKLYSGKKCKENILLDACNNLWNNGELLIDTSAVNRLFLSFRSLINVQLIFQRNENLNFMRLPILIGLIGERNPLYVLFKEEFNLTPEQFNFYAFLVMAPLMIHGENVLICSSYFDSIREKCWTELSSFINDYSKNLSELRDLLQEESKKNKHEFGNERSSKELIETPWLIRYPFLKRDEYLLAWHPSLYAMCLEETVHKRLSFYGQRYMQPFSKIFENYVLSLLRQCPYEFISEGDYKKKLHDKSVPAVDAIVKVNDNINLFVEVKASLFQDEILVSDNERIIYTKFSNVRKAFVQGWKVGKIIRKNEQFHISDESVDFLVVVVNRRINCGSAAHFRAIMPNDVFKNICPENGFLEPDEENLRNLPIENILIMSIDIFEQLILLVVNGKLDIVEFLSKLSSMNKEHNIPYFNIDEVFSRYFNVNKNCDVPLFLKEIERISTCAKKLLL